MLYDEWTKALPTVHPFYAVKCNNDPVVLKTLMKSGAGFDCASKVIFSLYNLRKHVLSFEYQFYASNYCYDHKGTKSTVKSDV